MKRENQLKKSKGREVHRFLIREAYDLFDKRGYDLRIEYMWIKGKQFKADVFAFNKKEKIVVECLTRPTLSMSLIKQKYRNHCDKLVLVYPSKFIPNFPVEKFYDESIAIDVPEGLGTPMTAINVSLETWQMLKARKKRPSHTFDEIIREGLFDVEEKEELV